MGALTPGVFLAIPSVARVGTRSNRRRDTNPLCAGFGFSLGWSEVFWVGLPPSKTPLVGDDERGQSSGYRRGVAAGLKEPPRRANGAHRGVLRKARVTAAVKQLERQG